MSTLTDDEIPAFLHSRPADPIDHVAFARASYQAEAERTASVIKEIDLRMAGAEEEIARLQRQLADDREELAQAERAQLAAKSALATLNGVR